MNTEHLVRRFEAMGARATVRPPAANNWRPGPLSINILKDDDGSFFDLRVQKGVELAVIDVVPKDRHLVLQVTNERVKSKFLCGHDERDWFVAALPESATVRNVKDAKQALRPPEVQAAIEKVGLAPHLHNKRKNRAYVRQGEWFFIPRDIRVPKGAIHRLEPIQRGRAKPHMCEELYRIGGTAVWVNATHAPNGISEAEYLKLDKKIRQKNSWRTMVRDAKVFVRGKIRHPDHATLNLTSWHEVVPNTETKAQAMRHVAFLD